MQRSTQAFVLLALLAGACTPTLTARRVKKQEDVRFRGKEDDEIAVYSPRSKLFRIAVVDFVDQTHNTAGKVEDMFADVMTTSLYRTSRFTLYDRSQLKRKNKTQSETQIVRQEEQGTRDAVAMVGDEKTKTKTVKAEISETAGREDDSQQAEKQMAKLSAEVDGIFVGFITNAEMAEGRGTYTIDYRIVKRVPTPESPESTLVIFADSATVHFSGNPLQKDAKPVTLQRQDLESIAAKVAEFFPRLNAPEYSNARVTDVNGRGVTISLGNKQVKPGYSFFVTTEPDEQTGEFYYKGSFVVRDAFEKASRADLNAELLDVYMKGIKPGDRVLMK